MRYILEVALLDFFSSIVFTIFWTDTARYANISSLGASAGKINLTKINSQSNLSFHCRGAAASASSPSQTRTQWTESSPWPRTAWTARRLTPSTPRPRARARPTRPRRFSSEESVKKRRPMKWKPTSTNLVSSLQRPDWLSLPPALFHKLCQLKTFYFCFWSGESIQLVVKFCSRTKLLSFCVVN